MPAALAGVYTAYLLLKEGLLAPITEQELDSRPASWVDDLLLVVQTVNEVAEAEREAGSKH